MSHHGREDEPSHSEAEWHAACRDSQALRRAICDTLDGTWDLDRLRLFAIHQRIIRNPLEVAREKALRKAQVAAQISALNAELAKLEGA
jgi:hypothetical protein